MQMIEKSGREKTAKRCVKKGSQVGVKTQSDITIRSGLGYWGGKPRVFNACFLLYPTK
jgi:hypothetical protein